MKTALNALIYNLQLELNGMGIVQYDIQNKFELKQHYKVMKSFEYCINEAKKLLEQEKQQIIDAVNEKYESLNMKAENYYSNKFELCKQKT
jgi:hypothetical protein